MRRNVIATSATYAHNIPDGKTSYEKTCGVICVGPLDPRVQKTKSRLQQFSKKMLPGILTGYVSRAGEDGQVTCSSRIAKKTLENPVILPHVHRQNKTPRCRTRKKAVVPMCGQTSPTLGSSSTSPCGGRPAVRTLEHAEKQEDKETSFEEELGNIF